MLAWGEPQMLCRPCVDCGLLTGRFCDGDDICECFAENWMPDLDWAPGQNTPFCRKCEDRKEVCHFCRDEAWARPSAHPANHEYFTQW